MELFSIAASESLIRILFISSSFKFKSSLEAFIFNVKFINANIPNEIDNLKEQFENKIFKTWCDNLVLCQDDHTLIITLVPIVNKFSDMKTQQIENETNMMLPFRNMIKMTALVIIIIPLLYFLSDIWFYSFPGQVILAITSIVIFVSIDAAIKLSKPIEYDI